MKLYIHSANPRRRPSRALTAVWIVLGAALTACVRRRVRAHPDGGERGGHARRQRRDGGRHVSGGAAHLLQHADGRAPQLPRNRGWRVTEHTYALFIHRRQACALGDVAGFARVQRGYRRGQAVWYVAAVNAKGETAVRTAGLRGEPPLHGAADAPALQSLSTRKQRKRMAVANVVGFINARGDPQRRRKWTRWRPKPVRKQCGARRRSTRLSSAGEVRARVAEIIGKPVDESFNLFPPFYSDFGRNISFGKGVFVNSCCHFQDQGGIFIGDGVLIGHNAVLATIDHDLDPASRRNHYAPIHIGDRVWIGANVVITRACASARVPSSPRARW